MQTSDFVIRFRQGSFFHGFSFHPDSIGHFGVCSRKVCWVNIVLFFFFRSRAEVYVDVHVDIALKKRFRRGGETVLDLENVLEQKSRSPISIQLDLC